MNLTRGEDPDEPIAPAESGSVIEGGVFTCNVDDAVRHFLSRAPCVLLSTCADADDLDASIRCIICALQGEAQEDCAARGKKTASGRVMIQLRPYQLDAASAMVAALDDRKSRSFDLPHPLCVIPTGGGKSLIIAEVIRRLYQRSTRPSMLLLSHVKELVEQDARALRMLAPEIPQGFYSAGLREKRGGLRVVMGTVQTVSRSLRALGARSYIFIDEAHLCPRAARSQYGEVFLHFRLSQRMGFTATPTRLDSGSLIGGDDAWFDSIAYEHEVRSLINDGYLLPLSGVLTEQQAVLDTVGTRAGDFIAEQAERAVSSLPLAKVIDELLLLALRRAHLLVFAAGVDHAKQVVAEMEARGVACGLVLGSTPAQERAETIRCFQEGALRALVNVGVLTTGFDAPVTDCIACLRPTKSLVLWQQMLGRGMRLSQGKTNCLLLDFVGNLERLGGAGCVDESVEDHRSAATRARAATSGLGVTRERAPAELTYASHIDPMTSKPTEARMVCQVLALRFFIVASRKQEGKRILIAQYRLRDLDAPENPAFDARVFLSVEYAGTPRWFAEQWFVARGVAPSAVPRDADLALMLAKSLPIPRTCRAFFSLRLKTYLVVERSEEFDPAAFAPLTE